MKKRKLRRQLKRLRRLQRDMMERENITMSAVISLLDLQYDEDDPGAGIDEPRKPVKLKVVGDGKNAARN